MARVLTLLAFVSFLGGCTIVATPVKLAAKTVGTAVDTASTVVDVADKVVDLAVKTDKVVDKAADAATDDTRKE